MIYAVVGIIAGLWLIAYALCRSAGLADEAERAHLCDLHRQLRERVAGGADEGETERREVRGDER